MLLFLLTGGIIDLMKMMEVNNQIFIHKNSKVEILMFRVFFGAPDKHYEKSLYLLKNIFKNLI